MCLVLFAHAAHPRHALVVAANRDEFHARAAAPAAWIEADILAGRDLQAGGCWFALARDGRFALVTNVREPGPNRIDAPSRGELPLRVVRDRRGLPQVLAEVAADLPDYNGCNLLAGSPDALFYLSNRATGVAEVDPGVHGLSNQRLDTPWPKVARGKARLEAWRAGHSEDLEDLFTLLDDRTLAADEQLPDTGVPMEWERRLSAAFIVSPAYGTRCSTVLVVSRDGRARWIERRFGPDGQRLGEVVETFQLLPPREVAGEG